MGWQGCCVTRRREEKCGQARKKFRNMHIPLVTSHPTTYKNLSMAPRKGGTTPKATSQIVETKKPCVDLQVPTGCKRHKKPEMAATYHPTTFFLCWYSCCGVGPLKAPRDPRGRQKERRLRIGTRLLGFVVLQSPFGGAQQPRLCEVVSTTRHQACVAGQWPSKRVLGCEHKTYVKAWHPIHVHQVTGVALLIDLLVYGQVWDQGSGECQRE